MTDSKSWQSKYGMIVTIFTCPMCYGNLDNINRVGSQLVCECGFKHDLSADSAAYLDKKIRLSGIECGNTLLDTWNQNRK